jgi:hypothetical protein
MESSGTNKVICGLSARERSLIVPHLRRFELIPGDVLNVPYKPVSHVYFPRSGLLSIVVVFSDGNLAEAALAGSNTVVGAIAAFGDGTALNQVLIAASGVADRPFATCWSGTPRRWQHSLSRSPAATRYMRWRRASAGGFCKAETW